MSNALAKGSLLYADQHLKNLRMDEDVRQCYVMGFKSSVYDVNPFDYLDLKAYCAWEAGYTDKHRI